MTRLRLRPAGCLAAVYLPSAGCAYGVERILLQCEARGVPYLFKLKHTLNVKRLVGLCLRRSHWEDAGDGWQCMESPLQRKGWHNIIDEAKNQWGWSGYTTRKAHRLRPDHPTTKSVRKNPDAPPSRAHKIR